MTQLVPVIAAADRCEHRQSGMDVDADVTDLDGQWELLGWRQAGVEAAVEDGMGCSEMASPSATPGCRGSKTEGC
ncbi:hypothetical protein OPAG_06667 [Rhodococcus opacus PD630]|uniref:hypothetical protein n=2 Tax=Nocardiaceae TaxID=85025 RepID=UPI00029CD01D|nr:hypothetical protein [Rhodococcus opacus]AHK35799.1 hypothetical protein Pd630_LPD13055 [Rhodococcus opacus PD630]EHI43390.1 hypothetical protein OPAG_06667 [Rhodococcus opacus PD630]KXX59633.1 hypothetical protein AZG88_40555 [Rhodococcus sp. LB1]UDH01428.1 hypothetical protein K2Z90_007950 [Rhodococcus opacus PD630]